MTITKKCVKKIKSLSALLTAFVLMISVLPPIQVQAQTYSASSLRSTFERIQNTSGYKHGTKYVWNDAGFFSDYCNFGTGWCIAHTGWQCFAYGLDIFGQLFQQCPMDHKNYSVNVNNLYVGDVIRLYWDDDVQHAGAHPWGHTIIIRDIVGDTVYYTDANSDGYGTITWDRSFSKSYIATWAKYVCHADGNNVTTLTNTKETWTANASNITGTNATVSARISLPSSVRFQWVGCNFFDANGNMVAQAGQPSSATGSSMDISYNIADNTSNHYRLNPGTTYKYQFYATYGSADHFSPMYSFKTTHQHSYKSKITKASTCKANGVRTYTCGNCGDAYTETISKTGHSYVKSVIKPTYTAKGYTLYKCSVCGDSYMTDYTDSLEKPKPTPTPKPSSGTGNSNGTGTGSEKTQNPQPGNSTALLLGKVYTVKNVVYQITSLGIQNGEMSVQKISDQSVSNVSIPASIKINGTIFKITEIASGAFQNCTNLKKVSINQNVRTIGNKAFYNCKKLKTVSGCNGVTKIGSKAFSGCVKLVTVGSRKNVITLSKVQTIGNSAFSGCKAIMKVNVTSSSLTKIDTSAFARCTSMTSFTAKSKKLASIGSKAFMGDKKLSSITLGTSKLTRSKVGTSAFKGIKSTCKVKVPASKVSSYKEILKARGAGSKIKITK